MTNREEFCALLYGTFYESISDSAIIRQQHEKIRTWVQSNIPSRLYRYRAVNDHTFDALRKDEIWGSSIFSFNDPFECMPHYDPERAKELLKREMDTLYQICCEKDIPCYKMVPAYLNGSFSIRPFEYEIHIEVTDRLKQKNML